MDSPVTRVLYKNKFLKNHHPGLGLSVAPCKIHLKKKRNLTTDIQQQLTSTKKSWEEV